MHRKVTAVETYIFVFPDMLHDVLLRIIRYVPCILFLHRDSCENVHITKKFHVTSKNTHHYECYSWGIKSCCCRIDTHVIGHDMIGCKSFIWTDHSVSCSGLDDHLVIKTRGWTIQSSVNIPSPMMHGNKGESRKLWKPLLRLGAGGGGCTGAASHDNFPQLSNLKMKVGLHKLSPKYVFFVKNFWSKLGRCAPTSKFANCTAL